MGLVPEAHTNSGALDSYVPRVLLRRLASSGDDLVETIDGTVMFVDISGFTKLSERLARTGKEGAERLADAIGSCFAALLADAYANGGSLLKFGGDALLLWFEGKDHAVRACDSAVAMRNTLGRIGAIRIGEREVLLRMSVGVHTGSYQMFLVGSSHREFVLGGSAATTVVEMEAHANAGQILISPATGEWLADDCLGRHRGPGIVLARAPIPAHRHPPEQTHRPSAEAIATCLSTELRAHALAGPAAPEHRTVTVAFLQFGALDELIVAKGVGAGAHALDQTVKRVQEAADLFQVCFLGSDIAAGGGKLILTAGAPRTLGEDEERILLAVRHVLESGTELPVRAGLARGPVFAGEIGPPYRRTYTVMGDTVNLAARLMARAPTASAFAGVGVLDHSTTAFEAAALEPFEVKGKSRPVQAWEVGPIKRTSRPAALRRRLPLVGRERELKALAGAVTDAKRGVGSLVEIVGDPGSGKSRLLTEAHDLAAGMLVLHSACDAYTRGTPYVAWRDLMRQLLDLTWEDSGDVVIVRLRTELEASRPDLLPWLPLLAIVFDAETAPTRQVRELAPSARVEKLHEVVLRFLEPALAVPTVVGIEHAHLMDEASAALLGALAARLEASAWTIVVTRRDAEDGFVADEREHLKLELAPLSDAQLTAVAESTPEAHSIAPHLLELAVQRASGSPEFLLDLLAAAASGSHSLPESVDAAVMARIDALKPVDRAFVRRAAVLGLSFHPRRLGDVLDDAVDAPDRGIWIRLGPIFARDPDGHVRFKRPALREAAYEGLPFSTRRILHRAVAEALERGLGSDPDAEPAVLSLHFALAGEHKRAYRYALQGAERATARFSHADAATLYRRAIEAARHLPMASEELAEAWEGLGEALRHTGEPVAAAVALTEARRRSRADRLTQARLFYRHAQVAQRSERLTAAVRWVGRGLRTLDGLESNPAAAQRARLLSALANIRQRQGRPAQAVRLCRLAIDAAEPVGELRALAHALFVLDEALVESGNAPAGDAPNSARALEIYERLGDFEQQHKVLNNMGGLAYFAGHWERAAELYRLAADRSDRAGKPADTAYADCNLAEILSDQGHVQEAEAHLKRARRVWSATGDHQGVAYADILLGRSAVRDGRYEEGVGLLRGAEQSLRSFRLEADADFAAVLIAEAEAMTGDARRALAISDQLTARADRSRALLHRVRAAALARLGRAPAAGEQLEASLAAARERGAEYDVAAAIDLLRCLGPVSPELTRERDSILASLHVERLPRPRLGAPAVDVEVLAR